MVILGFDPGGVNQFGWSVTETIGPARVALRDSGLANHSAGAVAAALSSAGHFGDIEAAGIDSPLFWIPDGDRAADKIVRNAMEKRGAKNSWGTVQQVNSLRGACLAQGIMVGYLLRQLLPTIRITESHPKALLWLLQIANCELPVNEVAATHMSGFIECDDEFRNDHQRDASLAAVGACAMMSGPPDWKDLYLKERSPFAPVTPVEYWMPIGATPDQ